MAINNLSPPIGQRMDTLVQKIGGQGTKEHVKLMYEFFILIKSLASQVILQAAEEVEITWGEIRAEWRLRDKFPI